MRLIALHEQSDNLHIYLQTVIWFLVPNLRHFFAKKPWLWQIFTGKNSDFRYGVQVFQPLCFGAYSSTSSRLPKVPDCIAMQPGD